MNNTIKNVINNPLYYIGKLIHPLTYFLPIYVKNNGIYSEFEKLYVKKIKHFVKPNEKINIMCADNLKLYDYLKCKGYEQIRLVDLTPNHILEKRRDYEFSLMSNIEDIPEGDVLICFNVLNSMSESCIRKWNDYANRRFGKIVYIGLKNKEYRSALGPECIGSHGCEQYCTENIKPILDECVDKNTEVYDARYYFFLTENIEDRKKYLK